MSYIPASYQNLKKRWNSGRFCNSPPTGLAAERASEGQKKPVKGCFKGIPVAYAPEIDGSAMWAPCEQHTLQYLDQVGINDQQQSKQRADRQ